MCYERRIQLLRVSCQVLTDILFGIGRGSLPPAFTTNLPPDCEPRGIFFNFDYDCFELKLEHPSFPIVGEGEHAPIFELVITPIDPIGAEITAAIDQAVISLGTNVGFEKLTAPQAEELRKSPERWYGRTRRGVPDFTGALNELQAAEANLKHLRDNALQQAEDKDWRKFGPASMLKVESTREFTDGPEFKAAVPGRPVYLNNTLPSAFELTPEQQRASTHPHADGWTGQEYVPIPEGLPSSTKIIDEFAKTEPGRLLLIRDGELVALVHKVKRLPDNMIEATLWVNGAPCMFTFRFADPDGPVIVQA